MEDSSILIMNGYHKPHHRVLKPPGGDTHDIFGTSAYNEATEASRRARSANHQNQLQSSIFDPIPYTVAHSNGSANGIAKNGIKVDEEEKEKNGNGEEEELEEIPLHGEEVVDGKDREEKQAQRVVKDRMKSTIFSDWSDVNGQTPTRRQSNGLGGGNPITGEGYANGGCPSNGEAKDSRGRTRYPPGGPSSNLW